MYIFQVHALIYVIVLYSHVSHAWAHNILRLFKNAATQVFGCALSVGAVEACKLHVCGGSENNGALAFSENWGREAPLAAVIFFDLLQPQSLPRIGIRLEPVPTLAWVRMKLLTASCQVCPQPRIAYVLPSYAVSLTCSMKLGLRWKAA
jgi:hypothetical protein